VVPNIIWLHTRHFLLAMSALTTPMSGVLTTDVLYRAHWQTLHDHLIACGWVLTTDTGQVNLTTCVRPAAGAYTLYEMWKMADALQATAPFFLKLEYGLTNTSSGNPTNGPLLRAQVGTTTNGTGTLGGILSDVFTIAMNAYAGTEDAYFGGSSSSWRFCLSATVATASRFFMVERDRNVYGDETGDGVHIVVQARVANLDITYAAILKSQYVPSAGAVAAPAEPKLIALLSSQISQAAGGNVGVGLVHPCNGPIRQGSQGLAVCARGDFLHTGLNSITTYGVARNYVALTHANTWPASMVASCATAAGLMLYT
jgi:hypothetical protein